MASLNGWILETSANSPGDKRRAWISDPQRTIVGYASAWNTDDAVRSASQQALRRLPNERPAIVGLEEAYFSSRTMDEIKDITIRLSEGRRLVIYPEGGCTEEVRVGNHWVLVTEGTNADWPDVVRRVSCLLMTVESNLTASV